MPVLSESFRLSDLPYSDYFVSQVSYRFPVFKIYARYTDNILLLYTNIVYYIKGCVTLVAEDYLLYSFVSQPLKD